MQIVHHADMMTEKRFFDNHDAPGAPVIQLEFPPVTRRSPERN
jgi:hypothetical protein